MPKPLEDCTGRCGACIHFAFYVLDGKIVYRGNCEIASKKVSSYRQASQKSCSRYKEWEEER